MEYSKATPRRVLATAPTSFELQKIVPKFAKLKALLQAAVFDGRSNPQASTTVRTD
jgi:hypothetical protein